MKKTRRQPAPKRPAAKGKAKARTAETRAAARTPRPAATPTRPAAPTPPPVTIPVCPPHLDAEAKAEWDRIVPELLQRGLLGQTDRAAIAAYCQSWSRWVDCELKIRELGVVVKSANNLPMQSPYLPIAQRSLDQMHRLLSDFGMTPSARRRVPSRKPPAAPPAPPIFRPLDPGLEQALADLKAEEYLQELDQADRRAARAARPGRRAARPAELAGEPDLELACDPELDDDLEPEALD